MSDLHVTAGQPAATSTRSRTPVVRDALVVLGWFVVAGLVGGVLWWLLTDLPKVTKSGGRAVLDAEGLAGQVAIDGWFITIAAVGGLVSAIVLTAWRRRDPVATVLLVVLGAGLASFLMVRLGHLLGPGEEREALRSVPEGGSVRMQLQLHAPGAAWVWPAAAACGSLLWLWITTNPDDTPH